MDLVIEGHEIGIFAQIDCSKMTYPEKRNIFQMKKIHRFKQVPKKVPLIIACLVLIVLVIIKGIISLNNNEYSPVSKTVSESVINVKDAGAKGDQRSDDTKPIQKTLDLAKTSSTPIKIVIPKGTYKLTSTLRIYKNTHLVLEEGAELLRSHDNTIMVNGDAGAMYTDYNGHGNITIEGGIWNGNIKNYPDPFNAIGIARGKNITIRNIEVRDVASDHAIDINASEQVVIENSKFLGFKDTTPDHSRFYSEAIQISEHTKLGFSQYGVYDGTPSKNITIRNSYFGASGTKGTTAWPVGIGNHGSVHNKFSTNIMIQDNTFEGITFVGIRNFKWKDTTIENNTFLNNNRGIALSNPDGKGESSKTSNGIQTGLPQSGSNTTISNNIFQNTRRENIYGEGWPSPTNVAKIESLIISKNVFNNQLGGNQKPNIYLNWIDGVTISNNRISNAYRGIYLGFASNVTISDNTFENIGTDGLLVDEPDLKYQHKGYTNNIKIRHNTLSEIGRIGLFIQYTKGFSIIENEITTSAEKNSFHVDNYSENGEIKDNTIITNIHQ
ncbi:right-handed parallel beta-helix repeat-containing protein [Peribacillus butanolivorans]|uniref:right-handed parallel beta-helix repeat-containing protein n=1 Tax=Peribacillus butanolivorans TaxID=421767 RepID=UPI0037F9F10F